MKRYKIDRLINLKYYFFCFLIFLFFCTTNIVRAEQQYTLGLVPSKDLRRANINDLKQLVINSINQKIFSIDEKDKQFILKNMPLFKIIETSNNFPSENSFFVSDDQYYFKLGLNKTHDSNNSTQKYKFLFKYKNKLDNLIQKTDLGEISESSETEIIRQVKRLNPSLSQINLKVKGHPSSTGVYVASDKHTDIVPVKYKNIDIEQKRSKHNFLHSNKIIDIILIFIFILLILCFIL
ncbi:MAG: hypothetical protein Q2306_00510 [Phytoplasma sp.]|uniref:hypothetical protein n=1 Tax=Phytoplasma sp. TaxID=2155 RepID=UPI002B413884|nr:hypothetical protein [Phytoplasma sp.]WRH06815.1 MAG: hypothetical protein Q2306_00510 [Phytoplasma sp.]